MLRQDILAFLGQRPRPGPGPRYPFEREQIAAAALMVECAQVDADFAPEEREAVCEAVRGQFGFDAETSKSLIEVAERRTEEVWHDWLFLEAVKRGFSEEEQLGILDRLWRVAWADGRLHPFEEHLISRIARELGFPELTLEETRTRARERLEAGERGPSR
jgi:uncharacterized tellurite resistance protein B-like protein